MPTLHETTDSIKTFAKWGGMGFGAIILIILLFRGGTFFINTFFPKPAPAPLQAFGKLPAIAFPVDIISPPQSYQLDTISGDLGQFPDRAKVYKTLAATPTLLDLQQMRASIRKTPFTTNETHITDTEYSWNDPMRPDKKIKTNIVSNDFTITSNYLTYPDLQPSGLIDQASSIKVATDFLEELGLYPLDIDPLKTTTQLLSLQGTSLFAASSLSTAQLIRIDFFQSDLDKLPIMYPHPPNSLLYFLLGGSNTDEILEGNFSHQTISMDSSTYPIISIGSAYDLLKKGNAYFASYYGTSNTISIKDVYLGYFMNESKQDYIMPMYVFEGKDGFFAYVSAVKKESLR